MPLTKRTPTAAQSKDQISAYAFRTAYRRIGRTPEKVLEWLIRFGEKDLRTISEREWDQLRNELTGFIQIGGQELYGSSLHEAIVHLRKLEESDHLSGGVQYPPFLQDPITPQFAKKLQSIAKSAIKGLIENGLATLPEITTTPFIFKTPKPHVGLYFLGSYVNDMGVWYLTEDGQQKGKHAQFIVLLVNVLKEKGSRLEVCCSPICRKIFVMHRSDQRYCTRSCRSRVAMKEWRQKRKNEKSKLKGGSKPCK